MRLACSAIWLPEIWEGKKPSCAGYLEVAQEPERWLKVEQCSDTAIYVTHWVAPLSCQLPARKRKQGLYSRVFI